MSPNVTKGIPIVIVTDESHHAQTQTRTAVSHVMPQLRLRNQVRPQEIEHFWENWHGGPESSGSSCYSFPSEDQPLPQSLSAACAQENIFPPAKAPNSSLSTPRSGKRWGFFGSKKSKPENAEAVCDDDGALRRKVVIKKKSAHRVLKKPAKFKSTPDLNALRLQDLEKVNAYDSPAPQLPPPLPVTLRRLEAQPVVTLAQREDAEYPSDSTIYFTMDPDWDESRGEVTLFFVPPPPEFGITWRGDSAVSRVDGSNTSFDEVPRAPRRRAQTHSSVATRKPQFMKPIDEADDSFLDLL